MRANIRRHLRALHVCIILITTTLAGVVHVQKASLTDKDEANSIVRSRNLLIKAAPASRCRECRCHLGVDPSRPMFVDEINEDCGDVSTIALMRRPRYMQSCFREQSCCDCQACRDSSPKSRSDESLSDVVAFCRSSCSKCADDAAAPERDAAEKSSKIVHSRTVTFRIRAESEAKSQPTLRIRPLPEDTHQKKIAREAPGAPRGTTDSPTQVKEAPYMPDALEAPPELSKEVLENVLPEALEAPPQLPKEVLEKVSAESDEKTKNVLASGTSNAPAKPLPKAVHPELPKDVPEKVSAESDETTRSGLAPDTSKAPAMPLAKAVDSELPKEIPEKIPAESDEKDSSAPVPDTSKAPAMPLAKAVDSEFPNGVLEKMSAESDEKDSSAPAPDTSKAPAMPLAKAVDSELPKKNPEKVSAGFDEKPEVAVAPDTSIAPAMPLAKAVDETVTSKVHHTKHPSSPQSRGLSPESWGLETEPEEAAVGPTIPEAASVNATQPLMTPATLEAEEANTLVRKALDIKSKFDPEAHASSSELEGQPTVAPSSSPGGQKSQDTPAVLPEDASGNVNVTQPLLAPATLEAEAEKMAQKALDLEENGPTPETYANNSNIEAKPAIAPSTVPETQISNKVPAIAPATLEAEAEKLAEKALEAEPPSGKHANTSDVEVQHPVAPDGADDVKATSSIPKQPKVSSKGTEQVLEVGQKKATRDWEQQYSRNDASKLHQHTCEDGVAVENHRLSEFVEFQSSCAFHFVGKGRAWYCACQDKDEDSCQKLKSLLAIPVLEELANVSQTDSEKIISGSPNIGWFCSSPQQFGSLGQKLFADSMDIIARATPLMAQQWAGARLKGLLASSADSTNEEVRGLSEDELSNLTAALVQAREKETAPAASGLLSFHGREAESERSNVFEHLVNLTGLPMPCVKARRRCERSPKCRNMSLTIMAEPNELVSLVAQNCGDKRTLSGVLRVLYECPGTLPRKAVVQAFSEFSELDDDDACPVVGAVSEELTKQLLPNLFAIPAPQSVLSFECVQAQQDCGKDFLCSAFVKTSASLSHSLMLHETLKLCTSKASMLRALQVAVECPGPFPSAEARILRHDLSGVESSQMCHRAVQLLPAIPSHYAGGAPLSGECLEAHRKCGAEPACSHAMDQMVRFSKSVPKMLDEALNICDHGNTTLFALEVSYKCPGMIPQKEARESHDALALLPESERCVKMKELFQVMSIMLSPLPSSACSNAKIQCRSVERCAAIQKEAFGDEEEMMTEAVNLCDDKPTMMSVLHFGAECEEFPQVLRQARAELAPIAPEKLCDEAKSFMLKLGPNAFERDASLSVSPKVAPVACTAAHKRCGGSHRCRPLATKLSNASMKEQMTQILTLCGKRDDFLAAVDVAAECPGHAAQRQMRDLKLALQDVPESELCAKATKEVRKEIFDSVPMTLPSLSCIRAHTACSLDAQCKGTVQNRSSMTTLEQSVLGLCGSRFSFLKAMQVAVECPGPQLQDELRKNVPKLSTASEQDLCQLAGEVLQRKQSSDLHSRAVPLDALFSESVRTEAETLSFQHARDIMSAFDVVPHDEKLNTLELGALLEEAAQREAEAPEVVVKTKLPESLRQFSLENLDTNGDSLVEIAELASKLSAVYTPSVERMAFVQSSVGF